MNTRSGKTAFNAIFAIIDEIIALISGLILPVLILRYFGSQYNGITTSITQFLQCIALLKAGIGGVTRFALYKPLAENNFEEISIIATQTEKFMKRVAIIFLIVTCIFASIYSIFISQEFDFIFSSTLVVIIAISTFVQYYFGFTYQMILIADQKLWICLIGSIFTYILNTLISALLIVNGASIHEVKLGSALVLIISPIVINIYTRKKYHITKINTTRIDYIKQRWDAVGHEIANFINNNAAIVVLTIFTNLFEVSVFSVYRLVISGLQRLTTTFIASFAAAFGNMYALGQIDILKRNLKIYETLVFTFGSILYSTSLIMILPFVKLYTSSVNDVEYIRPLFAYVIILAGAITSFRIPYQTIVTAIGHYKQTRNGAFVEALINIITSVILVIYLGLLGVAIGTLVAAIFRTIQYANYVNRKILFESNLIFISHLIISFVVILLLYFISCFVNPIIDSVFDWILYSLFFVIVSIFITFFFDILFFRVELLILVQKGLSIILHK